MTRFATLVFAVLMANVVPAAADDASDRHDASIALLNQMHTIDNVSAMLPTILAQVQSALTRGDPTLTKQFATFASKLQGDAELEKTDLIEQLAAVYAKTFTVDELKGMAAFYQTPLGQKIVATQTATGSDIFRVTREWGTKIAQKMAKEAAVDMQDAKP